MLMPLTVRQHVETTVDGARVMQATKVHGARSTSAYHTDVSSTEVVHVILLMLVHGARQTCACHMGTLTALIGEAQLDV